MVALEVGLVVAGTAAASLAVAQSARSVTPYAYLMAKIRAREARMLGDGKIESMAEANSVEALISSLRGSDYEQGLEGGGPTADELERALGVQMAGVFEDLLDVMPRSAAAFMRKFAERMELGNLKLVVQAVAGRADRDLAISHLTDGLVFSRDRLVTMAGSEGMEQLIEQLSETDYFTELERQLEPGEVDPSEMMRAMEHSYYLSVWRRSRELGRRNGRIARQLIGREADLTNIKLIFRLKSAGADGDVILKNLIPVEGSLGAELLKMWVEAESMETTRSMASASPLRRVLAPILSAAGDDVGDLEKLLDESMLDYAKVLTLYKPLTIATPLAFIYAKEAEMRNLRTLARCIEGRIPPDVTRRLVLRSGRVE
jgi:V/A-type H+-transporting ATPase subunit C